MVITGHPWEKDMKDFFHFFFSRTAQDSNFKPMSLDSRALQWPVCCCPRVVRGGPHQLLQVTPPNTNIASIENWQNNSIIQQLSEGPVRVICRADIDVSISSLSYTFLRGRCWG
ncbi:hypothetical protein VTI28DRAFT_287 [Corynascus sepedonium]